MKRLALALVVWAVVVAGGSTLVWAVISRAGDSIVATTEPLVAATLPATTQDASPTPSTRPRHSRHRPPNPSSSPASPTSPATPSSAAPAWVERTWSGNAGFVTAACDGATIAFRSAGPNAGWRMTIDDRGPARVRVEFARAGEAEARLRVSAACGNGSPVFTSVGGDG